MKQKMKILKHFLQRMFPTVEETIRVHDLNYPEKLIEPLESNKDKDSPNTPQNSESFSFKP